MGAPRRVVVKLGTNTVTGGDGLPDASYLAEVARQVRRLRDEGWDVVLVSSGAIGAGQHLLNLPERPQDVPKRQGLAAVGQPILMTAWEAAFRPVGLHVGQLLLTHQSFTRRESFLNLRNATFALLELGVVPVVNENDVVSIDEIDASFGDNDRLSAYVATKVGAELLVILSDVDGLHTRPPGVAGAQRVPVVEAVTEEVRRMAAAKPTRGGRGGMQGKLDAAELATQGGTTTVIAHGRSDDVLLKAVRGDDVGTRFLPQGASSAKEQWLTISKPQGRVHVDAGAADALRRGRHLLPAGVVEVEGSFAAGDVVTIVHDGAIVAKALTTYAARELARAKGLRSDAVRTKLGREGSVNVTRKDDLVLVYD